MRVEGNGAVLDFLPRVGYQQFVIVDFDGDEATVSMESVIKKTPSSS